MSRLHSTLVKPTIMSQYRPGDWTCPNCNNHCFGSRDICKDCAERRPGSIPPVTAKSGDWTCSDCPQTINFAKRVACFNCGKPKSDAPIDANPEAVPESVRKRARTEEPTEAPVESSATSGTVSASMTELYSLLSPTTTSVPESVPELPTETSTSSAVSASAPEKPKVPFYGLSIDIERKGKHFRHGILAIGSTFGSMDGTIIEQRAFCSHVPPKEEFEPDCWDNFWSKHTPVLERIESEAVDEPILEFYLWLGSLEQRFGPFGRKHKDKVRFVLISDNPGYDIGMINLEFFKRGIELPIAEMFDDYVSTDDPTEQMIGLSMEQKIEVSKSVTAPHDHWPVNDATEAFQMRCGIQKVLGKK